jgi:endonuclease YncB( thermonuclease family)
LQQYARWAVTVLLALFAVFLGVAAAHAQTGKTWQGTVTHVTDGDTLWVRPQRNGEPRQIRLDGIDAPEICQLHGETARSVLTARVLGQQVQVRVRRTDEYGRLLARISLQGQDVGGWMVSQGQAWSYRYRRSMGPYAAQEAQARAQGRGLFAGGRPELPRDFRKRHGSCR